MHSIAGYKISKIFRGDTPVLRQAPPGAWTQTPISACLVSVPIVLVLRNDRCCRLRLKFRQYNNNLGTPWLYEPFSTSPLVGEFRFGRCSRPFTSAGSSLAAAGRAAAASHGPPSAVWNEKGHAAVSSTSRRRRRRSAAGAVATRRTQMGVDRHRQRTD